MDEIIPVEGQLKITPKINRLKLLNNIHESFRKNVSLETDKDGNVEYISFVFKRTGKISRGDVAHYIQKITGELYFSLDKKYDIKGQLFLSTIFIVITNNMYTIYHEHSMDAHMKEVFPLKDEDLYKHIKNSNYLSKEEKDNFCYIEKELYNAEKKLADALNKRESTKNINYDRKQLRNFMAYHSLNKGRYIDMLFDEYKRWNEQYENIIANFSNMFETLYGPDWDKFEANKFYNSVCEKRRITEAKTKILLDRVSDEQNISLDVMREIQKY